MSVVLPGTPIYEVTFQLHPGMEHKEVAVGTKAKDELIRRCERSGYMCVDEKHLWTYGEGIQ